MSLNFKPLIRRMTVAALAALSATASWAAAPQSPAADSKERARLEELFIWKTSEELRLAPADEQKFTEAIHDLNQRRRAANARMDAALAALASAKTKAETDKALSEHRAALRDTQAVQTAELDRLRPLLGSEKLAKYIVAKSSILEKLKSMLAAPGALPAPAAVQASSEAPATAVGTTSSTTHAAGAPSAGHPAK